MERQVQRIQKVQLKPQVGPEDVDGSQLSSSWMQKRKVQRAFMQAQECWEHVKTRADEIFSKRQFSHSVEDGAAGWLQEPNEAMAEFKDVGTPACTSEEKQSTEHVKGSSA